LTLVTNFGSFGSIPHAMVSARALPNDVDFMRWSWKGAVGDGVRTKRRQSHHHLGSARGGVVADTKNSLAWGLTLPRRQLRVTGTSPMMQRDLTCSHAGWTRMAGQLATSSVAQIILKSKKLRHQSERWLPLQNAGTGTDPVSP
jgi:hypothetical protein